MFKFYLKSYIRTQEEPIWFQSHTLLNFKEFLILDSCWTKIPSIKTKISTKTLLFIIILLSLIYFYIICHKIYFYNKIFKILRASSPILFDILSIIYFYFRDTRIFRDMKLLKFFRQTHFLSKSISKDLTGRAEDFYWTGRAWPRNSAHAHLFYIEIPKGTLFQ